MSKMTPEMEALAEQARWKGEAERLTELVPHFTRYEGPVPTDEETLNSLPEPWRKQLFAENPNLAQDIMNRQEIANQVAELDRAATRVQQAFAGTGVNSLEEFQALEPRERKRVSRGMTSAQRHAALGADLIVDDGSGGPIQ